ncbi:MAG: hypothetical protein ABSB88_20300 [Bryobacteraceae bacterium]
MQATIPGGINAQGDVVGSYYDANWNQHGFLLTSGGTFTTIDYGLPPAQTNLNAINSRGDIVGTVQFDTTLPGGGYHSFIIRGGVFENADFPGHLNTVAAGITDAGEVVGCIHDQDTSTTMFGFILSHGVYTALDGNSPPLPAKSASMNNGATPDGGVITGLWTDLKAGITHGYLLSTRDGVFTPFDPPGSVFTMAWGINAAGQAVGFYDDENGEHGFLLSRGSFTPIDIPEAQFTDAFGINSRGDVVGIFGDSVGNIHGFLLTRAPKRGL